jgi:hypothetical protein
MLCWFLRLVGESTGKVWISKTKALIERAGTTRPQSAVTRCGALIVISSHRAMWWRYSYTGELGNIT